MMSDDDVTALETPPFLSATPHTGILGVLANRRQQIIDEQVLRLRVPRWESPKIEIEYKPVPHAILRRGANEQEQRTKNTTDAGKQASTEVDTNADILINGCIRIIAVLDDGSEMGLGIDGAYGRFDRDAALSLGMPENAPTRSICRELFITDADLLRTARKVSQWSGYTTDDVDEALEGE